MAKERKSGISIWSFPATPSIFGMRKRGYCGKITDKRAKDLSSMFAQPSSTYAQLSIKHAQPSSAIAQPYIIIAQPSFDHAQISITIALLSSAFAQVYLVLIIEFWTFNAGDSTRTYRTGSQQIAVLGLYYCPIG